MYQPRDLTKNADAVEVDVAVASPIQLLVKSFCHLFPVCCGEKEKM